jgi:hypothetical protein
MTLSGSPSARAWRSARHRMRILRLPLVAERGQPTRVRPRVEPPYLYRLVMATGSVEVHGDRGCPVWGVPDLLPAPDGCPGSASGRTGSRTGREPGRRSRRPQGVLDAGRPGADHARRSGGGEGRGHAGEDSAVQVGAFLCGRVTSRGGRRGQEAAASLTWVHGAWALPRRQDD